MKKKYLLFILLGSALAIYSCKTKQAVTATEAPKSLVPGDAELMAAKVKYPETINKNMSDGYAFYSGPCTRCHEQKDLFEGTTDEWNRSVERMAPKAKLTQTQKEDLWKYVYGMRTANGKK